MERSHIRILQYIHVHIRTILQLTLDRAKDREISNVIFTVVYCWYINRSHCKKITRDPGHNKLQLQQRLF